MAFVCERCAEGLSAEEIDADATYPDGELGGTDPETGGHLCKGCSPYSPDGAGAPQVESEASAEEYVYRQLAYAHPHEMFAADPERFWRFFQGERPGVSRELMESFLDGRGPLRTQDELGYPDFSDDGTPLG